ncbi:uncharacterized protein LOC127738397 isoform X2 [Mytilus californianus]|nr:uncharacterized protein LOC127738397 isoform X2 [Mytilus californianus]XP_052105594.1 uncharacterized protein LOC127738397 isoform X2 [Mytilus californianus]
MADNTSRYFISHSNKFEDRHLVNEVVIPKLKKKGIIIYEQDELQPGTHVLPAITSLVDKADKTLLFISENSLGSSWCSFELLISLEKSQRTNRLAVVLLLHKIEESQLPHIAVLQEARKIHFDEQNDEWVREVVEGLRETKTIGDIMPAGNVAHGLVWSHYAGLLQYVLPELEKTVKESEWYKSLTEEVRKKVSCKFYELVPRTCAVKYDIPKEDDNIKNVKTFKLEVMRSGNYRIIFLKMYSITIGQETCYCVCEFPSVIGTMKVMEDNQLARFSHAYPGEVREEEGPTTAAQFTTEDKKLQLGRFYYTMNSTLNHFDDCKDTARVLLYNDEKKKISDVLMEAIKKDLKEENFQEKKFKEGNQPPQIDRLESEEELQYEYQVYVAYTDHHEDKQKAQQIMDHLREKRIADSDILDADSFLPGSPWSHKLKAASCKCRWFIFLLTKNALKDKSLNYNVISALGDSIYRRKVRVIPVVDSCDHLFIPEALRWITYIPFDINGRHLESLYSIVSGRDIPMETQMVLPAGDVAYGLAWGYVTNYLMKILPEVLKGISPVFEEKAVKDFRCPHKLFIVIPKSCSAGDVLNDKQNDPGRIENFSKTAAVYPFGPDRAFHCNIYKVSPSSFNMNEGLYFVGQYAAPVTCLREMKTWNIAGVNLETMASEAKRFYEIVSQLMRNAVPEKAQFCEFIYYDDMTHSLADIMEQKIQSMKD